MRRPDSTGAAPLIRNTPLTVMRLITDYYNLYTIQLTAWTDAFGFDPRVSAKSYVRPGHNVTVALRTAHPRWRFESSCPAKFKINTNEILNHHRVGDTDNPNRRFIIHACLLVRHNTQYCRSTHTVYMGGSVLLYAMSDQNSNTYKNKER